MTNERTLAPRRILTRLTVVVGMVGIFILVGFGLLRDSEPAYQGKTVTEWLDVIASDGTLAGAGQIDDHPALMAITAIGPGAVPTLKRHLQSEVSLGVMLINQPLGKRGIQRVRDELTARRKAAALALLVLASERGAGLPTILEAVALSPCLHTETPTVFHVIGTNGPSILRGLSAGLGDSNSFVRGFCARGLHALGPQSRPALRALTNAVSDSDSVVVLFSISTLEYFDEPEVVELLIQLGSAAKESHVRLSAVVALGNSVSTAPSIDAALQKVTQDADAAVSFAAKSALQYRKKLVNNK